MLTEIERRLEALRKMKDLQLGTLLAYERAKREAIPPEVQAELDAIEAEYAPIFGSMNIDIAETENEVKAVGLQVAHGGCAGRQIGGTSTRRTGNVNQWCS